MKSVLLTAFGPYENWTTNASWLAIVEFAQQLPESPSVTTRLYPVDFRELPCQLEKDLSSQYDVVLHLGQAPGSGSIALETIAVNVAGEPGHAPHEYHPLCEDGDVAYRTSLPVAEWANVLASHGIPARISFHAGTYLCNATMYWTHYLCKKLSLPTKTTFIHLPLDTSQAINEPKDTPSLPSTVAARAIRILLEKIEDEDSTS